MEFKRFYKFMSIVDVDGNKHLINVDDISDLYDNHRTHEEPRFYIQLRSKAHGPDIEVDAGQAQKIENDLVRRYDAVVL